MLHNQQKIRQYTNFYHLKSQQETKSNSTFK